MFKRILCLKTFIRPALTSRSCHAETIKQNSMEQSSDNKDMQLLLDEFSVTFLGPEQKPLLEPGGGTHEDEIAPNLMPTFNLAAYANKSNTLQQFIKLGVDLHKIEKRKGLGQFFLKLDFDKDVKNHLLFLKDVGVEADKFGEFITKNPLIFKEDLDNLQVRVNYLQSKKFTSPMIGRIVQTNPFWLMFSTKRIDRRLGFFQKEFELNGNQIRALTCKQPRLITYSIEHVKRSSFSVREEMGFDVDEIKDLILQKPRVLMLNNQEFLNRFEYLHLKMKLPHKAIIQSPELLTTRQFKVRQRHEFLVHLNRAQYDPKKELYVSLKALVTSTEEEFITNIAKSCPEEYEQFLKTL